MHAAVTLLQCPCCCCCCILPTILLWVWLHVCGQHVWILPATVVVVVPMVVVVVCHTLLLVVLVLLLLRVTVWRASSCQGLHAQGHLSDSIPGSLLDGPGV